MNNYIVYVIYCNRLEFLKVDISAKDADKMYVEKANEWLHPDEPFETVDDVHEYFETEEYFDRDADTYVGTGVVFS